MSISFEFTQKDVARRRWGQGSVSDSPVDHARKQLLRGDGEWPGFDVVYYRLKCAAHKMAEEPHMLLSDEHVRLMAIMGCGHEETMKAEMHRLIGRGYINLPNTNKEGKNQ
jgi:hypothetical protein